MTDPNHTRTYRLLDAESVEPYLMAAYVTLSRLPEPLPGVEVGLAEHMTSKTVRDIPGGEIWVRSAPRDTAHDGMEYRLSVGNQGIRDSLTLHQDSGSKGQHESREVQRFQDHKDGKTWYSQGGFNSENSGTTPMRRGSHQVDVEEALDSLITMGSDFRATLTDRLADKPEILQKIEQYAADIQAMEHDKSLMSRAIGRLSIGGQ